MANTACSVNNAVISSSLLTKEDAKTLSNLNFNISRYVDYVNVLFGRVFAEEYINNSSYITMSDFTDDINSEIRNGKIVNLYNKVKEQLGKDIESNFYDSLPEKTVEDILVLYKNWDVFSNYHSKYNIFVNVVEDSENFDKKGNEFDEFELASNEVRTLFKFLPRAEFSTNIKGEVTITEALNPQDGLPMQSDYENIFKLTLDALKGIKDEDKFIEVLTSEELLKKIPELQYLFSVLPLKDNGLQTLINKQRLLFNSLYTLFSRDYIPVHASTRIINEKGLPTHIRYKSAKGNIDKIYRQFISNFSSDYSETEFVKVDNTEDEKNPENSGFGRKRLFSLPAKLAKIELNDEDLSKLSISKIKSQYKDYFDFLKVIGIEFSDLSLLNSFKEKEELIDILNSTLTIRDNLSLRIKQGIKIYNPIDVLQSRYKGLNEDNQKIIIQSLRKTIRNIAKFEGKFSKIAPTTMSQSASGEKQSDISFSNAISIAANQISNSNSLEELYTKSYFKKLRYNALHQFSYVSREIIGKNTYAIENYSGHIIDDGVDKIESDTRSLSDVNKFKADFSNLLGWGVINTPQLESKSSYFAIKFLNQNEEAILPYSPVNFTNNFMDNEGFSSQMFDYLRGELQRIKDYNSIKNSSYSVPQAYSQLHIFKGIVTEQQLNTLLNSDWDNKSAIAQEIKPAIEKFFQDQFKQLNNFIDKNNITDLITNYTLRPQNKSYSYEDALYEENPDFYKNLLLRTFIANDFIHNVEFGIFVSGDPLFYKDYHKRLGGLASTGTQPANTNNLRLFFNSDSEKVFWNTYSLRGILNQNTKKPSERRSNFNTFLSAVLEDDIVKEGTHYHSTQILEDFIHSEELKSGSKLSLEDAKQALKVYQLNKDGITVGDGQGYLNLDAHRELSIKQDTYRPQHDVSYMYEALIFKKYILSRQLTEQEESQFEKLEAQILKDPDKYALPVLKQTYYGTLANENVKLDAKVFDKFSLAPLLPSVAIEHPKLQKLLLAMATRQIHYVKYKSGTKGYVRSQFSDVNDLFNEKIDLDELQSDLLKLQITPSKIEKTQTKIPTQLIKLIYTNLFDKGNASEKVKELRNNFIESLKNIQSSNKEYVLSKLGFKTDSAGNIQDWDKNKIIDKILNQINLQKLPSNLIEALRLNEEGNFVNTIESSGVYQQILNYVTGKLDSTLRTFKVNGGDFVLISESMFSDKLKYFRLNKDKSSILPLECRITLTKEFSKLLNLSDPGNKNRPIKTIKRLNELLRNEKFVKDNQKALTITFSRPPVQGPNSSGVGIVKEFFYPTAGNILQLPAEFMHQAGIDFDYDKEKIIIPHLSDDGVYLNDENIQEKLSKLEEEYSDLREIYNYVDENLEESENYNDYQELKNQLLNSDNFTKLASDIFNVDINSIPDKLYDLQVKAEEYLKLKYQEKAIIQNKLLNSIIESSQLPELYSELVLPNTDTTVKPLGEKNGTEINNTNILPIGNSVYKYHENLKVFKMFNDAKALLGPFALHNTFSQLIAPLDIVANLDYMFDKHGVPTKQVNNLLLPDFVDRKVSISSREDLKGENKQHLNSEFINATVDSAKDPYFANFMLSFDNINTFMFLFTLNYPIETIVDFTSSAIVRKYLDLKSKNPDLKAGQLIELTFKESNLSYKGSITVPDILTIDKNNIGKDVTSLLENLKELKRDKSLEKKEFEQHHKDLIANFVAMEQHSKQLSNFKNLFKNDTNKTSSLFEIFSKEDLRGLVVNTKMFSLEDVKKVEDQSTITPFRNDKIISDVLNQVFPIASKPDVVMTLGRLFSDRKSSLNDAESRILSQIITNDFIGAILFTYGVYKEKSIYEYARNLITKSKNANKTYNDTLLERIYRFRKNKEYQTLIETFPVLTKIQGDVSTKPIKNNDIYQDKYAYNLVLDVDNNIPTLQKEGYMSQFKDIINGKFETKDPLVKEALINFVKDFFIAGLIQNGFNKSGLSYFEYAPIDFIQSLLNPALNFYHRVEQKLPENHDQFLDVFKNRAKYNNASYFYIPYADKRYITKNSYLGKPSRIVGYTDEQLIRYTQSILPKVAAKVVEQSKQETPKQEIAKKEVIKNNIVESNNISNFVEIKFKDKENRIRIDYPKEIEGLSSDKLKQLTLIKYDHKNIAGGDFNSDTYFEDLAKNYGDAVGDYAAETSSEVSINEAEFLRDNKDFADSFMKKYFNDDRADEKTMQDFAQILLNENETLVDTAQLSLFEQEIEDTIKQKENESKNCNK